MIKVLQYGEGNFLRTFVDVYFDTLNKNGQGRYAVNIFAKAILYDKEKINCGGGNAAWSCL